MMMRCSIRSELVLAKREREWALCDRRNGDNWRFSASQVSRPEEEVEVEEVAIALLLLQLKAGDNKLLDDNLLM